MASTRLLLVVVIRNPSPVPAERVKQNANDPNTKPRREPANHVVRRREADNSKNYRSGKVSADYWNTNGPFDFLAIVDKKNRVRGTRHDPPQQVPKTGTLQSRPTVTRSSIIDSERVSAEYWSSNGPFDFLVIVDKKNRVPRRSQQVPKTGTHQSRPTVTRNSIIDSERVSAEYWNSNGPFDFLAIVNKKNRVPPRSQQVPKTGTLQSRPTVTRSSIIKSKRPSAEYRNANGPFEFPVIVANKNPVPIRLETAF